MVKTYVPQIILSYLTCFIYALIVATVENVLCSAIKANINAEFACLIHGFYRQ